MRSRSRGQALVEWTVFGCALIVLWTASLQFALRLLNRVSTESWSVLGARYGISGAQPDRTAGIAIHIRATDGAATGHATSDETRNTYTIQVPATKADRSPFRSWLPGSLFSRSSE